MVDRIIPSQDFGPQFDSGLVDQVMDQYKARNWHAPLTPADSWTVGGLALGGTTFGALGGYGAGTFRTGAEAVFKTASTPVWAMAFGSEAAAANALSPTERLAARFALRGGVGGLALGVAIGGLYLAGKYYFESQSAPPRTQA
jgi:hypothetical protein